MTSEESALAPADLTIEVYTTPGRPFASAATPEGPGDDPTWSPSSATLIYGDHDAVLVDTLITYDQVDTLADWIETKGRRPSRIYITHGHGDHWLGLARLTHRFPGATGLATAEVLAQAADPGMAGYWEALFPGEIPGAGRPGRPAVRSRGCTAPAGRRSRRVRDPGGVQCMTCGCAWVGSLAQPPAVAAGRVIRPEPACHLGSAPGDSGISRSVP